MREETRAVRTGLERSPQREHSAPLFMTSSFVFDSADHARAVFAGETNDNVYSRYTNPNTAEFVRKLGALEGLEHGVATASGMAAVFATLCAYLEAGDEVLASRYVFGSTHKLLTQVLPRWGIGHAYADLDAPEEWEALITPRTRLCYVETPSNPTIDLIDLQWIADLCHAHDIVLAVDNAFATPLVQRPADFGADLVLHSATKYIDGQGRGLGGAILGPADLLEPIEQFRRHTGPALSPFNAWMFSKSLETLPVRMKQHAANALALAEHLEAHPAVRYVKYPFLASHPQHALACRQMRSGGGMLSFVLEGGVARGARFLNALTLCSLTANLGDTRTIATHPASTTHSKLSEEERRAVGILPGLVRISVGLEHVEDVIEDVDRALQASG